MLLTGVTGCPKQGEHFDYQPADIRLTPSSALAETEVVPSLLTPLAESQNTVWCATFPLVWANTVNTMTRAPLQVSNVPEALLNQLNHSGIDERLLPPGSYYTAAGRVDQGIVRRIQTELVRQFPNAQPPAFEGATGFVSYAYLENKVQFAQPYSETYKPIDFHEASGKTVPVRGFGLHPGTDFDLIEEQARQIQLLFSESEIPDQRWKATAFALQLAGEQADDDVIVAVLPKAANLQEALDDLERRRQKFQSSSEEKSLPSSPVVMIPNVDFYVDHVFQELCGPEHRIQNQGEYEGLPVTDARQRLRFRLDRSGATIVAQANYAMASAPSEFIADRPFLIVMKRRTAKQPYFVAWIETAELLEQAGETLSEQPAQEPLAVPQGD